MDQLTKSFNGSFGSSNGSFGSSNGSFGSFNRSFRSSHGSFGSSNGSFGSSNGSFESSNGSFGSIGTWTKPQETDPVILARRQKQIDYGKNSPSYENYIKKVPKGKRLNNYPKTPNKNKIHR